MGKLTISMAIFNSCYDELPEGMHDPKSAECITRAMLKADLQLLMAMSWLC